MPHADRPINPQEVLRLLADRSNWIEPANGVPLMYGHHAPWELAQVALSAARASQAPEPPTPGELDERGHGLHHDEPEAPEPEAVCRRCGAGVVQGGDERMMCPPESERRWTDEEGTEAVYRDGRLSLFGKPSLTREDGVVGLGVDLPEGLSSAPEPDASRAHQQIENALDSLERGLIGPTTAVPAIREGLAGLSTDEGLSPEELARLFHDTYEALAPSFGYETRPASAVAWEQVPEQNRKLMVATARHVLRRLAARDEGSE